MKGFFGDIFDFNRDGKLDSFEKAAEFAFLFHDRNGGRITMSSVKPESIRKILNI